MEQVSAEVVDLAQNAGGHDALGLLGGRVVAHGKSGMGEHAGFFSGLGQFARLRQVGAQRLFAVHVLAFFQCQLDMFRVQVVGRAHVHHAQVLRNEFLRLRGFKRAAQAAQQSRVAAHMGAQ